MWITPIFLHCQRTQTNFVSADVFKILNHDRCKHPNFFTTPAISECEREKTEPSSVLSALCEACVEFSHCGWSWGKESLVGLLIRRVQVRVITVTEAYV